jgi:hypothetical protein
MKSPADSARSLKRRSAASRLQGPLIWKGLPDQPDGYRSRWFQQTEDALLASDKIET